MKYFFRILVLPFVAIIMAVYLVRLFFKYLLNWARNGGELIAYQNDDKAQIYDIFQELKKQSKA
jgi:hypothetical protein